MQADLPPGNPVPSADGPGDEEPAGETPTPPGDQPEGRVWSPLQFGLKAILIVTAVWAGLLALGRIAGTGTGTAYGVVVCALIFWLFFGLLRLVQLPGSGPKE